MKNCGTAHTAVSTDPDWCVAIGEVLESVPTERCDIAFLFLSPAYHEDIDRIVEVAWEMSGASILMGCASHGVIGATRELEVGHAISMMTLALPGASLRTVRFTPSLLQEVVSGDAFSERIGVDGDSVNSWILLADPLTSDVQKLLDRLSDVYPHVPVIGGAAVPMPGATSTHLVLDGSLCRDGAIGLAIGGDWEIAPVLSQGCEPIGEPWTITGSDGSWLTSISNRPATDVLKRTLQQVPGEAQQQVWQNVVVGLAANEYQYSFGRGDFTIRNIIGYDTDRKRIRISGAPRVGQTIQFQLRDAATAGLDLKSTLLDAGRALDDREISSALLFTCNGRGQAMFGKPDHDVTAIERWLGVSQVAGMRCAGEIAPVGDRSFLHGFSASIGCFVRVSEADDSQ